MPNIVIYDKCNAKCKYCFADDNLTHECETIHAITEDELFKILNMIHSDVPVGLLGGEPTLHPEFMKVYNIINDNNRIRNSHTKLFTNGTKLLDYIDKLDSTTTILMNVVDNTLAAEKQREIISECCKPYNRRFGRDGVRFGINLYLDVDTKYFWDLQSEFRFKRIRCSVCTPQVIYSKYLQDRTEYFTLMKPIFLDFCRETVNRGCKLEMDCNFPPICYFTDAELGLIMRAVDVYKYICGPIGDLMPNGDVWRCFGSGLKTNLFNYKSWEECEMALEEMAIKRQLSNRMTKCFDCAEWLTGCRGGCLGFER